MVSYEAAFLQKVELAAQWVEQHTTHILRYLCFQAGRKVKPKKSQH